MDPATITALSAIFSLAREYGPLVFVAVVLGALVRAWRAGEFLSKAAHEQALAFVKQRVDDWIDRYKAAAAGQALWQSMAERAAASAEASQVEHKALAAQVAVLQKELEELRDDLRGDRRPAGNRSTGRTAREGA